MNTNCSKRSMLKESQRDLKSLTDTHAQKNEKRQTMNLRLGFTYAGVSECVAVTVLDCSGKSDDFLFHSGRDTRPRLLDFHRFSYL